MDDMTRVPFHRATVGEDEILAVAEVLRSGWLTMGTKTIEFEQEFARYIGAPHAIAVSSCTAALHLALEAIGLQRGDEVLLPTTTFTATAEVVTYLGARPILVDVNSNTMNLDVADAERRVTKKTKAIIPVHFAGQPCEMDAIHALAAAKGLRVVEDAAHALPAKYKHRTIGSISEFTAFSFYATKTLSTGEGGMIVTSNDECAYRMKMMRLHGISRDAWKRYTDTGNWRYEVLNAGYKYNLTDIQSSIGLVQLAKCDAMLAARQSIARRYDDAFSRIPGLRTPVVNRDVESAWHLYVLRIAPEITGRTRNQLISELRARGIGTSVHFIPLHLHQFYQREYGYTQGDFPIAEKEYACCLSLPIYPSMTDEEIELVIQAVKATCETTSVVARANEAKTSCATRN